MKINTILVAIIFTPLFLFGQNKNSMSFVFSPAYSYFFEQSEFSRSGTIFQLDTWSIHNSGAAWRVGVNVSHQFSTYNYFDTGLHFLGSNFSTEAGWFETEETFHKFSYLELPISVRHVLQKKKFTSYLVGGLTIAAHLSSSTDAFQFKNPFVDDHPFLNLGVILGGGFEYNFDRDINIYFQPTFRYDLLGLEIDENTDYHLYTIGLDLGVRAYF